MKWVVGQWMWLGSKLLALCKCGPIRLYRLHPNSEYGKVPKNAVSFLMNFSGSLENILEGNLNRSCTF